MQKSFLQLLTFYWGDKNEGFENNVVSAVKQW